MSRKVELRGSPYEVRPLTFGQLRRLREDLEVCANMRGVPTDAQLDSFARVIQAGLSGALPTITTEQVLDLVDLGNFKEVLEAVIGASGLEARPPQPGP